MKPYTITHGAVSYEGRLYQEGDTITLDDATASQLALHLDKPPSKRQPKSAESTDG